MEGKRDNAGAKRIFSAARKQGDGSHLSNRNKQPFDVPTAKTSAAAAAAAAVTTMSGLPITSARRSERTAWQISQFQGKGRGV